MNKYKFWFVVGSQDLYGPEVLKTVAERSAEMAEELDPLDEVKQLIASGVDKKTALAQVAKKRRIPKRELYNQLISEGEGISE